MFAVRRLLALTAADRALIFEAALVTAFVRAAIWAVPFARLRRWLERWSNRSVEIVDDQLGLERRVAAAASAIGRRLPGTTCLVEALVVEAMLRRRGARVELRFGVRGPHVTAQAIEAHAWIEANGRVVIGGVDGLERYVVLEDGRKS